METNKIGYLVSNVSNADWCAGCELCKYGSIPHITGDAKETPCMHDSCSSCSGTGQKRTGEACIHALSCPCPKCTFTC